jgi:APA family basic amino acid/polyamine antiporter
VGFAYSGWNASAYMAEEMKRPERNLPRSLLLGTIAVAAVYVLVNLWLFFAAPLEAMRGVVPVAEVAIENLFGQGAARWLALLVGMALLSSLSAYVLIGPRVYFAMARDGLFFRFAARIHPRLGTPSLSVVAQGACAAVMILSGTFEQLLTYIGFALGIFPWMAVLGVVLLRGRQPNWARPYRVWGYPFIPLVYLAATALILSVALVNRPGPSLVALLTVAAGVPAYCLTRRGERFRS